MLPSSCCHLSLLVVIEAIVQLYLLAIVTSYDDLNLNPSKDELILLPVDPEVEDGHSLTLNCTILPHYAGEFTNRDLYFRHGNLNFTNITVVGDKTAVLNLTWSLKDDNIGGGHVRCALPDRTFVMSAVQHVTVVRRPMRPNVTGCLLWNWMHVNCTWQPSITEQQDHMHTSSPLSQTLQWKLRDDVNDVWQAALCQSEVTDSCVWNISHVVNRYMKSESCCVQVFARIDLKYLHFEVQSVQFCFRPVHSIVVDKPRNITVVNIDDRRMLIHWQAPLLDWNHVSIADIVYALVVISQWSDTPLINQSVVDRSLSIRSTPHTRYGVTVKVKTVESHFWSKPTVLNLTTAAAEPKMSPPSLSNAFTVSHMGKHTRTVVIYWKTLPVQDHYGRWLSYTVLERKPPASHWNELQTFISADKPSTEVVVDRTADVELAVIARNEVGDTLPDVVMHLPAVGSSQTLSSPFVELIVELTNDSTVVWSWQLKSSEHANNLTLFWCRSHFPLGHCIGSIQWQEVTVFESGYRLTIDTSDTNHYDYGAVLDADDVRFASHGGINWATCLYSVSGLAAPVQNVRASVPSFGQPGQLLVTWDHPPCDTDYRHGYIRSLMLYYCRHEGTECVDEPSRVDLPGYVTGYNLTGLEVGEEYGIWMYSLSRAGQSPAHSNITVVMTSAPLLTPAIIAGVAVGLFIIVVITVVVFWLLCKKYCRRCRDKLWSPVIISVPPSTTDHHQSNTYAAAASSPMPIVEYSRISYTRQGSRLSSSSRDSGQFGVASNSPLLLTPDSGSDLAVAVPDNNRTERADQRSPAGNSVRPAAATTYVNDEIVVLRRPATAENNYHRPPPSSTTGPPEFIPLQPLRQNHPNEVSAVGGKLTNDDEDETCVTDSLVKSRQNGGHDIAALRKNSDYIPHEWMKM